MISIDEALRRLSEAASTLPELSLPTNEALHHVVAADVTCPTDMPRFDQSAMDGFAVRVSDLREASASNMKTLPVAFEVAAGSLPRNELQPGQAARIFTGAPMPPGADSVVIQENVKLDGNSATFDAPIRRGANLRRRGEETTAGERLLSAGTRLQARHLALLAHVGISRVRVSNQPRIAIVVTGNEVGQDSDAGISDSNGPMIRAWCDERGLPVTALRRVHDDPTELAETFQSSLRDADIVVSTGGVSAGDRDHVRSVLSDLGSNELFWKVAQKPGKPMLAATRHRTMILGLPGNPAAVFVSLHLYLARIVDLLCGHANPAPQLQTGILASDVKRGRDRSLLLRARQEVSNDGKVMIEALTHQPSHMLRNLPACNAIVPVDPGEPDLRAGETVRWLRV